MRITVFGAGAIGGYLAARLAAAGRVDLSLVARGAHLDAIKANGLTLIENGARSIHTTSSFPSRRTPSPRPSTKSRRCSARIPLS
jgi:ketopantoate reductase